MRPTSLSLAILIVSSLSDLGLGDDSISMSVDASGEVNHVSNRKPLVRQAPILAEDPGKTEDIPILNQEIKRSSSTGASNQDIPILNQAEGEENFETGVDDGARLAERATAAINFSLILRTALRTIREALSEQALTKELRKVSLERWSGSGKTMLCVRWNANGKRKKCAELAWSGSGKTTLPWVVPDDENILNVFQHLPPKITLKVFLKTLEVSLTKDAPELKTASNIRVKPTGPRATIDDMIVARKWGCYKAQSKCVPNDV